MTLADFFRSNPDTLIALIAIGWLPMIVYIFFRLHLKWLRISFVVALIAAYMLALGAARAAAIAAH